MYLILYSNYKNIEYVHVKGHENNSRIAGTPPPPVLNFLDPQLLPYLSEILSNGKKNIQSIILFGYELNGSP